MLIFKQLIVIQNFGITDILNIDKPLKFKIVAKSYQLDKKYSLVEKSCCAYPI